MTAFSLVYTLVPVMQEAARRQGVEVNRISFIDEHLGPRATGTLVGQGGCALAYCPSFSCEVLTWFDTDVSLD
jgi:hypothetical protein